MDCREIQERLSEFQDGTLPPGKAGPIAEHIRDCGECARTARSLAAVREGLRALPQLAAPPELLARIRDAVEREGAGTASGSPGLARSPREKSLFSRLRVPLEAAAAVLIVASIWWYQRGSAPSSVSPAPPAPASIAAPAPPTLPEPAQPPRQDAARPLRQETRLARRAEEPPSPASGPAEPAPASAAPAARGKAEVASLPAGTPEPKPRAWSAADLPAAPALRTSSEAARIVPGATGPPAAAATPETLAGKATDAPADAAPAPAPRVLAAPPSRLLRPLPYGREIVLDVAREGREGAGDRIAAAARRLGGSVERVERDPSGADVVAVRVLLPEPAAPAFLSELDRIGKVPPEGKPAEVDIPAGPTRGTVAYTVRIRIR